MRAILLRTMLPAAVLLFGLAALQPASARTVHFSADAGPSFLGGPSFVTDYLRVNDGVTGSVAAAFEFEDNFNLIVRLEYHRLPIDDTSVVGIHEALEVWMIGTMLQYVFLDEDETWRPFIGLGYSTADVGWADDARAEIETYFDSDDFRSVLQIGAGFQIRTAEWLRVIAEGRLVVISSPFNESSTTLYPITIGVRF